MQPLIKTKREISSLVPYRKVGKDYEFFLQKRDMHARNNKGLLGFWGGGLEAGETPEKGLFREMSEELSYKPMRHVYFSRYETNTSILHIFVEEVSLGFESQVIIGEGEYGVFLKQDEILYSNKVSMLAQLIIHHLLRDFLA